jgi:hypothetical protein
VYEYIEFVSTHILLIWFLGERICVSNNLVLENTITVGCCLQVLLSGCSVEDIGVSSRLVPTFC